MPEAKGRSKGTAPYVIINHRNDSVGHTVSRLISFLAFLLLVRIGFAADLKVGLIVEDVTPPIGVPQGGYAGGKRRIIPWDVFNKYEYATFLRPSTGTLDPIRIKVMVLRHDDKKIAFLSSDTVGIKAEFLKDLITYLGDAWNPNEIVMGATHSHSGPGGLAKNVVWQLIAMDRFLPQVYWRTVRQTGDAIIKAYSEATEAELFATEFKADGLQKNRRHDHAPMHFDPVAHLILAKNAQGWLGGMVNFAIHGTSLGEENLLWSADVPGAIEHSFGKALAKLNGDVDGELPIVFFNGAVGDVKPVKSGLEKMLWIGEEFARQAMVAMGKGMRPVEGTWHVETTAVNLGTAKLVIRGCIPRQSIQRLIPRNIKINVGWFNPKETDIWLIKLGDIHMVTWPGEATTNLGLRLRKMARTEGINQSIFLGLTNDYTVYYTDEEEFDFGEYEACSSLYGPLGGRRILAAHEELLRLNIKKNGKKSRK